MKSQYLVRELGPIIWLLAFLTAPGIASAQVPGGCNTPVRERTGEVGCYLTATELIGALPQGPAFWHLDVYSTRGAAGAAKGTHGTVVESLGRVWLFTIGAAEWRASGGERIATVGPLETRAGKLYTARYMEGVFSPGMKTRVHRHSGPEAWYLLAGSQCLETPEGASILRAGESGIVPEGPVMILSTVGKEMRRSVLLVLHESSEPWDSAVSDWQPKGSCPE